MRALAHLEVLPRPLERDGAELANALDRQPPRGLVQGHAGAVLPAVYRACQHSRGVMSMSESAPEAAACMLLAARVEIARRDRLMRARGAARSGWCF